MSGILISAAAFAVTLGVLVTFHEFGHFWVARRLGVRVLRFSVGFGRPLWRRTSRDGTEYALSAIPLGGYVKMLDEREGPVPEGELGRAFNRQSVARRFAIVAAGPIANLVLAVLVFYLMFLVGVTGIKPKIGSVAPDSAAAQAGLQADDVIVSVGGQATPTWEQASLGLLEAALGSGQAEVTVRTAQDIQRQVTLQVPPGKDLTGPGKLLPGLGISEYRPKVPPVLGQLVPGGPAAKSGLKGGDRIVAVAGTPVHSWEDLVAAVQARPDRQVAFTVRRDGRERHMEVAVGSRKESGKRVGFIGARAHVPKGLFSDMVARYRPGPLHAVPAALGRTWKISLLTLQATWKMIVGQVPLKNISGPISIARYAGESASIGLAPFLGFLAVVSVSLAILNLLPIPVLDGGHLLYYVIEVVKGRPLSEQAQAIGQQIGLAALLLLIGLALYNDLARLHG
ncbi:MAG TPA: RIP metalloprotease RseP [Gammaproteobacteria bacterium]|nr:RIP metalloprotease RseP [Gammaproteobacteria bacterium]